MTSLDAKNNATALTPELVLQAYRQGYFPMADSRGDDECYFVKPQNRCLLPIRDLHINRRLRKILMQEKFTVKFNRDFAGVIKACAAPRLKQADTWINAPIEKLFIALHGLGYAHSVETYEGDRLVGGLYGLALGGVFCGESMFHRTTDASKVALCHLAARLYYGGYDLLDAQIDSPHLQQFGAYLIPAREYENRLQEVLQNDVSFLNDYRTNEMQEFLNRRDSML